MFECYGTGPQLLSVFDTLCECKAMNVDSEKLIITLFLANEITISFDQTTY